jgi:hypothetical protein
MLFQRIRRRRVCGAERGVREASTFSHVDPERRRSYPPEEQRLYGAIISGLKIFLKKNDRGGPLPNLYSQLWVTVTRVTVVSVNRDHLMWTQLDERKRLVYDFSGFESGGRIQIFFKIGTSKRSKNKDLFPQNKVQIFK